MGQIKVVGVDVFVQMSRLPELPAALKGHALQMKMISNRGTKVWPGELPPIHLTDVFCCRFMGNSGDVESQILDLLSALEKAGWRWVHLEKLMEFEGKAGYSVAQGE